MELAFRRAQERRGDEKDRDADTRRKQQDARRRAEQDEIIARTLRQHSSN
jgi:hypothetical protein